MLEVRITVVKLPLKTKCLNYKWLKIKQVYLSLYSLYIHDIWALFMERNLDGTKYQWGFLDWLLAFELWYYSAPRNEIN